MRSRAALANSDRDTMNGTLKATCTATVAHFHVTHQLLRPTEPTWLWQPGRFGCSSCAASLSHTSVVFVGLSHKQGTHMRSCAARANSDREKERRAQAQPVQPLLRNF
jgi:hypothetical protein